MTVKYDLPIPRYGTKTIVVKNSDNVLCNIFYEIVDDITLNILSYDYEDDNALIKGLQCIKALSYLFKYSVVVNDEIKDIYDSIEYDDKLLVHFIRVIIKYYSPNAMFDKYGDLYLFHAGNVDLSSILHINLNHYGSEVGNGLYTCLTSSFALNHRMGRCSLISVYTLDLKLILETLDYFIFGIRNVNSFASSDFDLIMQSGPSRFCRQHGGQCVIKTKHGLQCLNGNGCYYRSEFRELIIDGKIRSECEIEYNYEIEL